MLIHSWHSQKTELLIVIGEGSGTELQWIRDEGAGEVATCEDRQTCRECSASQDRSFSWPGSVEWIPIMRGGSSSCVWYKREGVLGCGSGVAHYKGISALSAWWVWICVSWKITQWKSFCPSFLFCVWVAVQCDKYSSPGSLHLGWFTILISQGSN